MGKIKVRKKLTKKKKIKLSETSTYILVALVLLVLLFGLLISFSGKEVYKIESRKENVEEHKKNDTDEFNTVGWVRVQGTNIDYPIINIVDEDYGQPVNGESYAWTTYDGSTVEKKIDISSHNILNLGTNPVMKDKMFIYFEELMNFVYYDFAKENQFIQLHINGEDYIYKIFSVNFLKAYDVNRFARLEFGNDELTEFTNLLEKGNLYNHDVDVNKDDKLISLYTCTRFFGGESGYNFSITGRLLRDNEKVELSTIEKTEKYDEIVELMKGGEDDE